MREILFKVKRYDKNEWVEGYLHKMSTSVYEKGAGYSGFGIQEQYGTERPWSVNVDPSTICQSTGFFDKNGVRIFEGDIVALFKTEEYAKKAIVFFRQGSWIITDCEEWDFLQANVKHIEVVGNVYDNPDLLKGEV